MKKTLLLAVVMTCGIGSAMAQNVTVDVPSGYKVVVVPSSVTVSQAIRMLLVQIVQDKELPFKVKAPNAKTRAVMDATDRGEGLRTHESTAALFKDLDI